MLNLRLTDGAEFCIVNAGHARIIHEKLHPGGRLTAAQREWLEQFRIAPRMDSRTRLRVMLRGLRCELQRKAGRK